MGERGPTATSRRGYRNCSSRRGACFRLPGAPKTVSLANSLPPRPTLNLRPSPCVRHIAQQMPPGRPNAHPGRTTSPTPDPFAPPYPEKSVTFPRHPFPALPHPTPRTPYQSSRLRHFSPPIRPSSAISPTLLKHPHIRATLAQARDRPRGPETLPPTRGKAPGIRKGVPCGRPVAVQANPAPSPCPLLPRGATLVSLQTGAGITDSRGTGDTLS